MATLPGALVVRRTCITAMVVLALTLSCSTANAETDNAVESPRPVVHQSMDDAWWTGPMLAPSAATLPRGHFLLEPYLYNVRRENSSSVGSLTYVLYGLANKLTVGGIPTASYNFVSREPSSSGVGVGDMSVQAQYRLLQGRPGNWKPTLSLNVQETLPTGKYDRLGNRTANGQGSGTHTTTLALYSQKYFWLPNGRILRMRWNMSQAFASGTAVDGTSVYGTEPGFRGSVGPSRAPFLNLAGEYSVTRNWVVALDATYRHDSSLALTGSSAGASGITPVSRRNLPSRDSVGFAPAIEYNWRSNIGVLLGARILGIGHNTTPSVTPAIALNFVH